ncbi:1,2-phenylacetyl-CoA epoxidase subunit PaaC [Priestia endophytica]|uniref:1,2-phenylacetyl-CoA epoxidase subunit PaaC n=1 Tax=Priestia endophytica TaxID=135735 RepID=UPI002E1C857E|nr:1,2-phenylacetyl-CoA epoxidase subunit PaaC [Priestia endophytica]MED4072197.1 phenylacetate-CoA oxygenase subunit PaaC [Priestia endophytica]
MSATANLTNPAYTKALTELLFQLADDDFLFSYRGSEWLGLAPHIEEDVASSSISQDSMGHAVLYYRLLEELGHGSADELAHARSASERKNSILVERVNGPGHYMEDPQYDWAYAVVRNYFYTLAKKVKIDSLKQSSYPSLADIAVKINMELYYHLLHWKTWFVQLLSTTEEAKKRMNEAIGKVMKDFNDVFSFGNQGESIPQFKLIEEENVLKERWIAALSPVLESVGAELPREIEIQNKNGRNGEHTHELEEALLTLGEVYRIDPAVPW